MRKIFFTAFLSFLTIFTMANNPQVSRVNVNVETSTVKWKGSKITKSHDGIVSIAKGVLLINHGTLVGGEMAIDMNSITCTDIESEKKRGYFEQHLKNEDFFDVEKFPYANIKITSATKKEEGQYSITADLTIKGITHPITFTSEVKINGEEFLGTASFKIDRTKWGVKYGSGSFFKDLGDKMILDDIDFDIILKS